MMALALLSCLLAGAALFSRRRPFALVALSAFAPQWAHADIIRWDNGQLIPGTGGFAPRPAVILRGWNADEHNLRFADLSGLSLQGSALQDSWMDNATFTKSNLSNAALDESTLTHANLSGANLTNANLRSSTLANANMSGAIVTGASFEDTTRAGFTYEQLASTASYQARVLKVNLGHNDLFQWDFGGQNLSKAYFGFSVLSEATLTGANLTSANLRSATLANADLRGAIVAEACFANTTLGGFGEAQLASTASYQAKLLEGIDLSDNDLTGWNFGGQNLRKAAFTSSMLTGANLTGADLTNTNLRSATLANADLSGASVAGASFADTTRGGFSEGQLASTASYQAKVLEGIDLSGNDLTRWNLGGQNLRSAELFYSTLAGANLSGADLTKAHLGFATMANANLNGAVVAGASFASTTRTGFIQAQLVSTGSYQAHALQGIDLGDNDLSNWDLNAQDLTGSFLASSTLTGSHFVGANLTGANLYGTDLSNAQLTGANLADAYLGYTVLRHARFDGAVVRGASFYRTTLLGFTEGQLASTASFQAKTLRGIDLGNNDLSGWNLDGQDLAGASLAFANVTNGRLNMADVSNSDARATRLVDAQLNGARFVNANLDRATLEGATLSGADMRGAYSVNVTGAALHNTIGTDGTLEGLELNVLERLVIHDDDGVPNAPPHKWLTARPPISITIDDHMTMSEDGVLELRFDGDPWNSLISFEPGIPVQLGGTLELTFAQNTDAAAQVGHTLHLFSWTGVLPTGAFSVSSLYDWDLSNLYTTGEATLLAAGGVFAGDANEDGKVFLGDFGTLKDHFGAAGTRAEGDANGDGQVGLADFGLLKANFGKSAAAAVPEPASIVLAILAVGPLLAARRCGGSVSKPRRRSARWRTRAFQWGGFGGDIPPPRVRVRPGLSLGARARPAATFSTEPPGATLPRPTDRK